MIIAGLLTIPAIGISPAAACKAYPTPTASWPRAC
jgi:hypothetical protein